MLSYSNLDTQYYPREDGTSGYHPSPRDPHMDPHITIQVPRVHSVATQTDTQTRLPGPEPSTPAEPTRTGAHAPAPSPPAYTSGAPLAAGGRAGLARSRSRPSTTSIQTGARVL